MKLILIVFLSLIQLIFSEYTQWKPFQVNLSPINPEKEGNNLVAGWQTIELRNITQLFSVNLKPCLLGLAEQGNLYEILSTKDTSEDGGHITGVSVRQFQGIDLDISVASKIVVLSNNQNIMVVQPNNINMYNCDYNSEKGFQCNDLLSQQIEYKFGVNVTAAEQFSDSQIYISSDTGLYTVNIGEDNSLSVAQTIIKDEIVFDISINRKLNIVAVGTVLRVGIYYSNADTWRYDYTGSVFDNGTSLAWREIDNTLWVASAWATNIAFFDPSVDQDKPPYKVYRAGVVEGLPNGNITQSFWDQNSNTMFFGGSYGVASFSGQPSEIIEYPSYTNYKKWQGIGQIGSVQSPWNFFQGQRWVTAGNITSILSISDPTIQDQQGWQLIYISSAYGLTILQQDIQYKIERKATHNEKVANSHNRYGYFSDASLKVQGDFKSTELAPGDSDSIWTNMYLAAQSFRNAVQNDLEAQNNAKTAFQALKRLYTVTGIKGFMARTIVKTKSEIPAGSDMSVWHESSDKQWFWKSGTSSDDVISFYFGMPAYIQHICENQDCKNEAIDLLKQTTDYIMSNDWKLIDYDGKPTKWGFWGPSELNENEDHYGERGINSLEIISMLSLTYHYTKESTYLEKIQDLGYNNNYFQNILNFRLQKSDEANFSDDELGYMAFFAYFSAQDSMPEKINKIMIRALKRQYAIVQAYNPSLYTYLTALYLQKDSEYKNVVSEEKFKLGALELQQWPLDWIEWNIDNSDRQDVIQNKEIQRNSKEGENYGVGVLKRSERAGPLKWNANPYMLNSDSNGMSEVVSTGWLLPYYLQQYLKSIDIIQKQYCDMNQQQQDLQQKVILQ